MTKEQLSNLKSGMRVRYRTSRRDTEDGTRPEYSDWAIGTLYVARRLTPYKQHPAGEILGLTIEEINWAEYTERDYFPEYNEWLAEEYRLQFSVLK